MVRRTAGPSAPLRFGPTARRGKRDDKGKATVPYRAVHGTPGQVAGPMHFSITSGGSQALDRSEMWLFMYVAGKLRIASANKHRRGPSTSRYKPLRYTTDLRGASLRGCDFL